MKICKIHDKNHHYHYQKTLAYKNKLWACGQPKSTGYKVEIYKCCECGQKEERKVNN